MSINKSNLMSNISFFIIAYQILNYFFPLAENSFPCKSIIYIVFGYTALIVTVRKKFLALYCVIFLCFIGGIINYMINGNITIKILIQEIPFWGIAIMLAFGKYNRIYAKILFYIVIAIVSYYFFLKIDPNLVLESSSKNYLSVVIILTLTLYYSSIEDEFRLPVLPAILGFVFSLWGESRSGIFSLTILLIGVLLIRYKSLLISKKIKFIFSTVLIISLIPIWILGKEFIKSIFGIFLERGLTSVRFDMWNNYLTLTGEKVLFILLGTPLKDEYKYFDSRYGLNLHNTFFTLHEYFGLLAFLCVLMLILYAIYYYVKKNMKIKFLLLSVLCVRGLTDSIFFATHNMPVLVYLLILPIIQNYQSKSANEQRRTKYELRNTICNCRNRM